VKVKYVIGVDFSGARLAGNTIWIARAVTGRRLRLLELHPLTHHADVAEREPALAHLVSMIRQSNDSLWAIDAPFGLPTCVMDRGGGWQDLLRKTGRWRRGAYAFGLHLLERGRKLGTPHVYRPTDRENKTPFDCYHYRIIYQTFHGMRDVLLPLSTDRGAAILPFQCEKLSRAKRVLVETCPSSTLKRLGLPHHTYKQPAGGPLSAARRRTRHRILSGIEPLIDIAASERRKIMRDPGGDALDAVLAAAGVWQAWNSADHVSIARDQQMCREGKIYA
jgi:hypothetical protein